MHELAVTEDILKIALEEAAKFNAVAISDIFMTIGQLSSIVDDSVQFFWDHISKGTIAEGAKLHFNRPASAFQCRKCGKTFEIEDALLPCPACQSFDLEVVSGNEMQVDHIEIITKEDNEQKS